MPQIRQKTQSHTESTELAELFLPLLKSQPNGRELGEQHEKTPFTPLTPWPCEAIFLRIWYMLPLLSG